MDRRKRQERKRKKRQERLRQERHERHYGVAQQVEDDEPQSEEDAREQGQHISPFLWESSLRHARRNLALGSLLAAGVEYEPESATDVERDLLEFDRDPEGSDFGARFERGRGARMHEFAVTLFPVDEVGPETAFKRAQILQSSLDRLGVLDAKRETGSPDKDSDLEEDDRRARVLERQSLADCELLLGRVDDAVRSLKVALELDPQDELRTRARLIGLFLLQRDLGAARSMMEDSPRPRSAAVLWGRVLERFLAGHQLEAGRELVVARQHAAQIEEILVPIEERVHGQPLDELDVFEFLVGIGPAWKANPAVTAWLDAGGRAPGAEELRQALASYAPPVDRLLTLGPIEIGKHPTVYGDYGLRPPHVPDLVRMMIDRALHDANSDEPYTWAPVHALRALAELRAPETTAPLLDWFRTEEVDDWFLDEMPIAFGQIGPVAVPPLRELARDAGADLEARTSALNALEEVARVHPDSARAILEDARALLRDHAKNPIPINGYLVGMLAWHGTVADIPLIESAFAAGRVDPLDCGTLKDCIAQVRTRGESASPS